MRICHTFLPQQNINIIMNCYYHREAMYSQVVLRKIKSEMIFNM